jgi:hypothetical protein
MHISNEDNVTVSATYGQGSERIDCSFQQQTLSDKDPAVHN